MEQILGQAIKLAEEGVPVPYKTAVMWDKYKRVLKSSKQAADILNNGEPPQPGEKLYAQKLAQSFKVSHNPNIMEICLKQSYFQTKERKKLNKCTIIYMS